MSDTKFTPAPWRVHKQEHARNELWLTVLNGSIDVTHNKSIATNRYSALSDEENLANAHLIAASPDLYSALEAIIKQWDTPNWKLTESTGVFITQGRKALAKARGEA